MEWTEKIIAYSYVDNYMKDKISQTRPLDGSLIGENVS